MAEGAVADLIESAGQQLALDVGHHIYPKPDLGAVKRRLSDDALGTVAGIGQKDFVSLVGYIAEEVALDDGCDTFQFLLLELFIAVKDSIQLLLEAAPCCLCVYNDMIFLDFALSFKTGYLGPGMIRLYNLVFHFLLR